VLIALSGCMRGMQCGRSASAVGDAATSAVVTGIVFHCYRRLLDDGDVQPSGDLNHDTPVPYHQKYDHGLR